MSESRKPAFDASPLAELVERLCHGDLTSAEANRLEKLVIADPAARSYYARYLNVHANLPWVIGVADYAVAGRSTASAAARSRPQVLGFLADAIHHLPGGDSAVGALLVLAVSAAFWGLVELILRSPADQPDKRSSVAATSEHPNRPRALPVEARPTLFARLIPGSDCIWAADSSNFDESVRDLEPGQSLELAAGTAQIVFGTGTRMNISGPVHVTLKSSNQCDLARGRLFTHVPAAAVGFRVSTPTAEVVDLGTEFGVEVDGDGQSRVNVVTGKVDVFVGIARGGSGETVRVVANQAVRVGRDKRIVSVPFEGQKLVRSFEPAAAIRSPADVPGLRLWLSAQHGVTTDENGRVARWTDQSMHGYDATQSQAGRRPQLKEPTDSAAAAIHFDGVDDFLECANGLELDNAADSTFFFLIGRVDRFKANEGVFCLRSRELADWNSGDGFTLALPQAMTRGLTVTQAAAFDSNPASDNLQMNMPLPAAGPYLVTITKKGGIGTFRLNGTTELVDHYSIPSNGKQSSVNTAGYLIGARSEDAGHQRPGVSQFGQLEILEILVCNRAIVGAESAAIEDYLRSRSSDSKEGLR